MSGPGDWLAAYVASDPAIKCRLVAALAEPSAAPDRAGRMPEGPGRPARPRLVHPSRVPRRRLGTSAGRAALVHAITHIEFNAINLALDAALRFAGLPLGYYRDWISVARDEARHFQLLSGRLVEMGMAYGDLDAHDGLWEMAMKTAQDPLARMALVPRVLEARGLDVTPGMIRRLAAAGDPQTVAILETILGEEIRHVAIGSRWFTYLCEQCGTDPQTRFLDLLTCHTGVLGSGAELNLAARRQAGFTEAELAALGG